MSPIPDPKRMARALRAGLARRNVTLTHGEALELVARQLGYESWNVLCAADAAPAPVAPPAALPDGWARYGRSDLFLDETVPDAAPGGRPAIRIASRMRAGAERVPLSGEFLTVMQSLDASALCGSRVTFSVLLRTDDATGAARIWINAHGASRERLAFANLGQSPGPNGPVSGDTDWTRRRVTLDIPEGATLVNFGFLFGGGCGIGHGAEFRFGPASPDEHPEPRPVAPHNLELRLSREDVPDQQRR